MLKRNKSNTEDILFDNSKPSFALVILNMRYNKRGGSCSKNKKPQQFVAVLLSGEYRNRTGYLLPARQAL